MSLILVPIEMSFTTIQPPIPWFFAITQMEQSKVKVTVKKEPPYITLSACIVVIITQQPLPPNRHI